MKAEHFKIDTRKARRITETTEEQTVLIDKIEGADHQNVLMVFKRADVSGAPIDGRTGERVWIEEISDKELPLIYQSQLAEQRIKAEIRAGGANVFHKGFVVDVNVRTSQGRPAAYAVASLGDVIDLPSGEDA